MPEGRQRLLDGRVRARGMEPGCGFLHSPRGHSLAPTNSISQGLCSPFRGWEGELSGRCCFWHGVLPALVAGNAFTPLSRCFGTPPVPLKARQSGLESRPGGGFMGTCQTDGMCWTHLHSWSGSSSGHILPLLLSPWKSIKTCCFFPSFFFYLFFFLSCFHKQ